MINEILLYAVKGKKHFLITWFTLRKILQNV